MDDTEATNLERIQSFLEGSSDIRFTGQRREETYAWIERTLDRHHYPGLTRGQKGLVRRYIARMTGLSRAQVSRLIKSYIGSGRVKAAVYRRRRFASRYTKADVELLAYVDKGHGNLSGPATRRILEREHSEYGQAVFERLSGISVAQIYRFRNSEAYRKCNTSYQPTRPTVIAIGERRKPRPQGRPGYLRIDTVHQGDKDGMKGVYHINAVDEVTQGEIVAGLLEKLLIEQTKSRAYRTGDNGLVESKNGAIIRKHMGFFHIAAPHAEAVNQFHRQYLNPYVNYHRPCAIPEIVEQPNGKRRRVYRRWDTPFEIFRQTAECESYLRPGLTMAELERVAKLQTDTEAAIEMQQAKRKLLAGITKLNA